MFGWKKSKESENVCPYCSKHCTEDHLRCDRGKEYFHIPLGKKRPAGSAITSSSSQHKHHHHSSGSSSHSGSNIPNYSLHELDTMEMTRDELTYGLFCKCRYIFRDLEKYGSVNAGSIFASLSDEEKDTLNILLRKFVEAHMAPIEEE